MSYLLDTNICIAFLNGTDPALRDRLMAMDPTSLLLCSVVKAELAFGARKSARVGDNLNRLVQFFHPFHSLPFDDSAAEQYGQIRATLERNGKPIGANDMLIAAIALAHDLTVVTRNVGEFSRVTGLRVEDFC
ncbi:type II toxin-antitoxin system VapC family toxin [bacterium]|nr:type II toxin-antitoxin system VapC family toxin [bacterium]